MYRLSKCLLLLIGLICVLVAPAQSMADSLDERIVQPYLQHAGPKREVLYLHANKQAFLAGEPLAFKVYILAAHNRQPFLETRNVYIDFYSSEGKLVDRQILYAEGGTAEGTMNLDGTLAPGTYYLRAYTAWSRNFGEIPPCVLPLQVLGKTAPPVVVADSTQGLALGIYPEGGNFIAGVDTRFGLKLTAPDGFGRMVRMELLKNGVKMQEFVTNPMGFASIRLTATLQDSFAISWTQPSGARETVWLPRPAARGISFAVDPPGKGGELSLHVRTNYETLQTLGEGRFYLVYHRQGIVSRMNWLSFVNRKVFVSQRVPVEVLPEGVVHITLFDSAYRPVADRAVFVRKPGSKLSLQTSLRQQGDTVTADLLARDGSGRPVVASLSMAFLPSETLADRFSSSLPSRFLLEQELKGGIENSAYYFQQDDSIRRHHLDELLLVQAWRRYDWTAIQRDAAPKRTLPFEQGFRITGQLPNFASLRQKGARQLILSSPRQQLFIKSDIDSLGRFAFDHVFVQKRIPLSLYSLSEGDARRYKELQVETLRPYFDTSFLVVPLKERMNFVQLPDGGMKDHVLEAVKVTARAADRLQGNNDPIMKMMEKVHQLEPQDKLRYQTLKEYLTNRYAARTYEREDPETKLIKYHVSFNTPSSINLTYDPVLVIDGLQVSDLRMIEWFPMRDIESIAVSKSGSLAVAFGAGGAIVVKTRSASDEAAERGEETTLLKQWMMEGYSMPSAYYMPAYTMPVESKAFSQLACIYWKGDIETDSSGKAQFRFYCPGKPPSLKVIAEGVGPAGGLLHSRERAPVLR
jgi:hypothetical protein